MLSKLSINVCRWHIQEAHLLFNVNLAELQRLVSVNILKHFSFLDKFALEMFEIMFKMVGIVTTLNVISSGYFGIFRLTIAFSRLFATFDQ